MKQEPAPKLGMLQSFVRNQRLLVALAILLMIGLNILIYTRISFIFVPLQVFVKTVMLPVILAGVAYYLLSPIVDFLEKRKVKRIYSILGLYVIIVSGIVFGILRVIPLINEQLMQFINNFPSYGAHLQIQFQNYMNSELVSWLQSNFFQEPTDLDFNDIIQRATEQATAILKGTVSRVGSIVGAVTEIVLAIVTLPFILFYLLKDGKKLPHFLVRVLPSTMQKRSLTVMSEMNHQISSYIRGQIVVSCCIGILLYIGYIIIGLDYSLTLAVIAACTSIVPYLGPAIAISPALIVAFVHSPFMLLKMIIVWTVVQLIEGKFISPQIMGKTLHVHPITIIFVILTAGNLFGIVGILLAIPGYAVLKVVCGHLFEWYKSRSPLYQKN